MSYENKILQMKKMLGKKPVTAKQKVEEPAFKNLLGRAIQSNGNRRD